MSTRSRRHLTVPVLAVALVTTLTGCDAVIESAVAGARAGAGETVTAGPPPATPASTPSTTPRPSPPADAEASGRSDVDVFTLRLGDCFDHATVASATHLASVPKIPCDEPHDAEIYAETRITAEQFAVDGPLTGLDVTTPSFADTFCYEAFAPFVGTSHEESTLDYTHFSPTQESWDQGDDVVQCVVVHLDGGTTGSMRDSRL